MNSFLKCSLFYLSTTERNLIYLKNRLQSDNTLNYSMYSRLSELGITAQQKSINSSKRLSKSHHMIHWTNTLDTKNQTNQISFLSWNVLAQYLFDSTPKWYTHVQPGTHVSWAERFIKIISEIVESRADIVCLQEVEFAVFEKDFQPMMKYYEYDGVMQKSSRKAKEEGDYGVATFWKSDKFQLLETIHRSRTMVTILHDSRNIGCHMAVMNCHLEGHPEKSVTRVRQLQSCLHELSTKHVHHRLVVCGDFNCVISQSAAATYMQKGSVDKDQYEWGRLVEKEVSDIPPHSYDMHSAYPLELLDKSPLEYITFMNSPGSFTVGLDQIWYHDSSNQVLVQGLRHPFHSSEQKRRIMESGLPSADNPSDHLAIGCILEWNTKVDLENLQHSVNYFDSSSMSAKECEEEAMELLSSCPFDSEAQKEEMIHCLSEIPGLNSNKGPPTAEQIEQIRDRRSRKKAILDGASEDVHSILDRIVHLVNAARAKRNRK